MDHAHWMSRCLHLARLGASGAAPNPMVGAVLVKGDRILAEGWHQRPGSAHAERDCLERFGDSPVPEDAVLYVSLEPCAHHGRTPPCADLVIERGVKRVVVAHNDPFPQVNGQGVERLRRAGIEVIEGVLADEARWMNRRFLTSVTKQRPYIVLKWAQSRDGFLDQHPRSARGVQRISSSETDVLVHRWRSEEQAILVGSTTVRNDDPRLDVRHLEGRQPLRVVIDRGNRAPADSHVFDGTQATMLITTKERSGIQAEQVIIASEEDPVDRLITELNERGIRSLLVEGGAQLHAHFLQRGSWDEARVITGAGLFGSGTSAPRIASRIARSMEHAPDRFDYFLNESQQALPGEAWPW